MHRSRAITAGAAILTLWAFASSALAEGNSMPAPTATASETASVQVSRKAPDFTLKDTDGKEHSLASYLKEGKTVVLEWFNPDCPFVRRHHQDLHTMANLNAAYREKGVVWLAINSNAPGQQGAGLERNQKAKKDYKIDYPILIDEAGTVGRAYGAKTTPHMFVIAKDGTLLYGGAIDDDPRGAKEQKTNYVGETLKAHLGGTSLATTETTSYGCSVKYGKSTSM